MAEDKVKRQHYVPRFYLEGFSANGRSIYGIRVGHNGILKLSTEKVCVERDLYETAWRLPEVNEKYLLRNDLEKRLSEKEGSFSRALGAVLGMQDFKRPADAELETKATLAEFVSNLLLRNPKSMPFFLEGPRGAEMESELETIGRLCDWLGFPFDSEALYEAGTKRALLAIEDDRAPHSAIAKSIKRMHLSVLDAPAGSSFATSSFPVLFDLKPNENGIETPVSVYLPISSRRAILFSPEGAGFADQTIDSTEVDKLNSCYLPENNAYAEWILAEKEETLANLAARSRAWF